MGVGIAVLCPEVEHLGRGGQLHPDESGTVAGRSPVGVGGYGYDHLRSAVLIELNDDRSREAQSGGIRIGVGALNRHAFPIK